MPEARDREPVPEARDREPVREARNGSPAPAARNGDSVPAARNGNPLPESGQEQEISAEPAREITILSRGRTDAASVDDARSDASIAWPKNIVGGLVLPAFAYVLVVGLIVLLRPEFMLETIVSPQVWLLATISIGSGVLLGLSLRLFRAPRWLAYAGCWLPVVAITAYLLAPAFTPVISS